MSARVESRPEVVEEVEDVEVVGGYCVAQPATSASRARRVIGESGEGGYKLAISPGRVLNG